MKIKSSVFSTLFLCCSLIAAAQLSGRVTDAASGATLPDVTIFLNKTSFATTSNASGEYFLNGAKAGFAELIVYKKGYDIFKSPLRIAEGHLVKIPLQLKQASQPSISNPVKSNKERASVLAAFKKSLMGSGPGANYITIVNETALSFYKSGTTVSVMAAEPIVMVNPTTGYKIFYYLDPAYEDVGTIAESMIVRFDTVRANDRAQSKEWSDARESFFFGSARHLFSSLVSGTSAQQGFTLKDEQGNEINAASLVNPVATRVLCYKITRKDDGCF